jgi:hypothetical protein
LLFAGRDNFLQIVNERYVFIPLRGASAALEPVLKFKGVLFSHQGPDGEARAKAHILFS